MRAATTLLSILLAGCAAASDSSNRQPSSTAATSGWRSPPSSAAPSAGSFSSQPQSPAPLAGGSAIPAPARPASSDSICEVVHLTADPQTPDMMIVLDRSGSMQEGGRWNPSVSAVRRVTAGLQSTIRFGLAMFPDPAVKDPATAVTGLFDCFNQPDPQACLDMMTATANASVCAPGAVVVPIAAMNAMAIGQALDATRASGGTPTSETLERLVTSFAGMPAGPDATEVHAKYVLLVTDGQPTCPAGRGESTTPPDIEASNKAIEALTAREVKTYVVGYDTTGAGNEMLAAVLDGFAQRGGTGDKQHRPVEDETSLLTELQRITGEIVGCSFTLDKPPSRADFVLVRLDGKQINLNDGDGWRLVGDRTVELTGAACNTFRGGGSHILDAEVQCSVVGPA